MKYQVCLNQGNEYLGSEKTITVNEVTEAADNKFVAHHIHMHNALIPEQVAESVLQNFCEVAAELMAQGFAIQLKSGNDVMFRMYGDIHVKGNNINLTKAKELDPTVTELTLENAASLVDKVGVTVRAKAECEQKFTDLLLAQGASVTRVSVAEKAKVERKNNTDEPTTPSGGDNTPDPNEGGSNEE